jgi:hypothetical protein
MPGTIIISPSREAAKQEIAHLAPEGSKLFTAIREVSGHRSGQAAYVVSVYAISDAKLVNLSSLVTNLLGLPLMEIHSALAVQVIGAGLDAVESLASQIATVVYGNARALRSEVI